MNDNTPVLVIGGGATGTGILRDLSLRGIPCLLAERNDLATGTSGRFHGLLHSGARYAVKDPGSAMECMKENLILKEIAPGCIEDTGGVFVALREDDPSYIEQWLEGCRHAGISTEEISPAELAQEIPLLSSSAHRAYLVPDAAIDGFSIASANAQSALAQGAEIKTCHEVTGFRIEDRKIQGAFLHDRFNDREEFVQCSYVINAAGPWAGKISELAGETLPLLPDMGILLAFHYRFTGKVLNRLRPPGDGDIFVPHGTVTIFGTTSKPIDDPDHSEIEKGELLEMLWEGAQLIPGLESMRIIRAFAGVRPLINTSGTGREASREFTLIDHEQSSGLVNMLSIIGGKFTTYRHMAQQAVDIVAARLKVDRPCITDKEKLPEPIRRGRFMLGNLVCECENVTGSVLDQAAQKKDHFLLSDLRRLTRLGMGPCQGAYCSFRATGYLHECGKSTDPNKLLIDDVQERWNGSLPVLWGWQARQSELSRRVYLGLMNMERLTNQ